MQITGRKELPCSVETAWSGLTSPDVLKACIPGCESVEWSGDDSFRIAMALSIGPVKARFTGNLSLFEKVPPMSTSLRFDGQGGIAGFGKGTARVTLTPAGSGCSMEYEAQAHVGGKLAQIGSRLVEAAASQLTQSFFDRFSQQTGAGGEKGTVPSREESVSVGSAKVDESSDVHQGISKWRHQRILIAVAAAAAAIGVIALIHSSY